MQCKLYLFSLNHNIHTCSTSRKQLPTSRDPTYTHTRHLLVGQLMMLFFSQNSKEEWLKDVKSQGQQMQNSKSVKNPMAMETSGRK